MIRAALETLALVVTVAAGTVSLYRWYRGWRWHPPPAQLPDDAHLTPPRLVGDIRER